MKGAKFSQVLQVIKPEYVYLKLKPNNAIRNNDTHKIARTIASLYRSLKANTKKERAKLIRVLGREFLFGTKWSFTVPVKVAYYMYMEKKKVEFYIIVPRQHLSVMKEKLRDVWKDITIEQVQTIPIFSNDAVKYQLVYGKEDAMSLQTDRRNNELLKSNMNVIEVLEEGDRVGVFYNFIPVSQFTWRSIYTNTIKKVRDGKPVDRNKISLNYMLKRVVSFIGSNANEFGEVIGGSRPKEKDDRTLEVLERALERVGGRKQVSDCTLAKGNDTILDTQIMVLSDSPDELRRRNNAKSLAQSFDSISGDNHLIHKNFTGDFEPLKLRMNGVEDNKTSSLECQNFIAVAGRELLEQYKFIEKVETQETEVPEDLRSGVMCIGTNRYRGKDQPAYLSTDKEYKYLNTVLIGPTRAGKSTLIENMIKDALNAGECVILFDYIKNCELSDDVARLFTKDKVLNIVCDDFRRLQGLGFNEVGSSADPFVQYDNAKKQTTQLLTLVNAINTDDTRLSAKMERYLNSAALVAFISSGSIKDVFNVLLDHQQRMKFIRMVPHSQRENLEEYMQSLMELNDHDKEGHLTGTKTHLIIGIIDRLNKLKQNTYMELMLKKATTQNLDLSKEIQKNQLICIRMPEYMFNTDGERDVYTIYWISKLWLALQVRGQRIKDRSQLTKVNLFIDELYQVNNTEKFLAEKLSRLAKFGIKPIISCHYLNQIKYIRDELRSANSSYMLISGCDKNNFNELKDELAPFELEDLLRLPRFHSLNLIKNADGYARFITKLPKPITGN